MVLLPEPGTDWGGFRIDRQIGLGGRGRTFAAFDPGSRRTRALKVLLDVPSDDPAGERFQREPLAATELGHPNIVTAHGSSDIDGVAFVIMDLYPGGSLADEIGVSTLRIGRAREVLAQVASALDTAHAAGIGHLNVKPTNILGAEDGHSVVLSDFGCTRFIDEARRTEPVADDEVARLPFHEAPEVLLGAPAGPAADMYSLGSVLFLMLSGRPPYTGSSPAQLTDAHRHKPVPALTALRPDLPRDFDDLVARAMAKDPAERLPDGKAFLHALDDAVKAAFDKRRDEARRPLGAPTSSGPGVADPWEPAGSEPPGAGPAGRSEADPFEPEAPDVPDDANSYGGRRKAHRDGTTWRLSDGTIDGAMLGVYEEEPTNRRLAVVVAVLLLAAVGATGWFVWQAIEADKETVDLTPTTQTTTSTAPPDEGG